MADKLSTQPYKGTRDFYPEDMRFRRWMFGHLRQAVESYGYQEYDGPLLEPFDLYASKTSEEIVSQQLYWLVDRGERKMAIRPEMTPTLARMVAGKLQDLPKPIRWYSLPNLWRYERPQRGRLREHWQLNVDVLGGDRLQGDAEILAVAGSIFEAFGGSELVRIKINNRKFLDHVFRQTCGLADEATLAVTRLLDEYFKLGAEAFSAKLGGLGLSPDQIAEVVSYTELGRRGIAGLSESKYASEGGRELVELLAHLDSKTFEFDPCIVRGFQYYTGTVFEAYDVSPENTRALFGGGRYDNLIGLFGKQQLSGVGFGLGDVSLQNFLETHKLVPTLGSGVDVLVTNPGPEKRAKAQQVLRQLRASGFRAATTLDYSGFGKQIQSAVKLGARFVVLLGDEELGRGEVGVKNLASGGQASVREETLVEFLRSDR